MADAWQVFGVDFTSRPCSRKPIVASCGTLAARVLALSSVLRLADWSDFESFLNTPGPWRAAFDFPFAQPTSFTADLGIGGDWEAAVQELTRGGRKAFEALIRNYCASQPKGRKHRFRATDRLAGACSPMMLDYTPVAKMFFEGSPRLMRAGLSILPVRVTADSREAIEGYPKLVAKRYVGRAKYKSDKRASSDDEPRKTRCRLLDELAQSCRSNFGFCLELGGSVRQEAEADPSGDVLDSILCAVQAAWSLVTEDPMNGIPKLADRREGWIVDPLLIIR